MSAARWIDGLLWCRLPACRTKRRPAACTTRPGRVRSTSIRGHTLRDTSLRSSPREPLHNSARFEGHRGGGWRARRRVGEHGGLAEGETPGEPRAHSDRDPPRGEPGERSDRGGVDHRVAKGRHQHRGPKPARDFTFFRPWVTNPARAFASAPSYPIGSSEQLYLSDAASGTTGVQVLTPTSADVSSGSGHVNASVAPRSAPPVPADLAHHG